MQGQQVTLTDGSTLLARTLGAADGGGLTINAIESVELSGFSVDPFGPALPTSLLTDVAVFGTGQGGSLTINTGTLQVADGALISAGTFDIGNAGALVINAQTVELLGGGPFGNSGLFTDTLGPGTGGSLTLNTGLLLIADGGQISSSTLLGSPLGSGPAGPITINADTIVLSGGAPDLGASSLLATVETDRPGGTVSLSTGQLIIENGAQIAATTLGSGQPGEVEINAQTIELTGTSPGGAPSELFVGVEPGATGAGSNLTLNAEQLQITDGAQIATSTFGLGNAGDLQITATEIQLVGTSLGPTGLAATVEPGASGNGGNLTIDAARLQVLDGAQIATSTAGTGNAGTLTVNASQIELTGGTPFASSGLFANALLDTGAGGNILVTADQLTFQDGATISASNFQSLDLFPPGLGPAGSIQVQATTITLDQQAAITAATAVGDQGNLSLQAQNIFLDRGSTLTTNAGAAANGGNITLLSEFLVLNNGSAITANAVEGQGGNIQITTEGLFQSLDSSITASSAFGVDGIVSVNSPETDPSQGLVFLSEQPVDVANLVGRGCQARELAASSFVKTGRSGLPAAPTGWLGHHTVVADVRPATAPAPATPQATRSSSPSLAGVPDRLVEAQGWITNAQGQTVLVAQSSTVLAQAPARHSPNCTPS